LVHAGGGRRSRRDIEDGGVRREIYRYDAAHAFANERSAAYDVACANQAWERMTEFLGAQTA
jgi:carboxymethylenebutenolidase